MSDEPTTVLGWLERANDDLVTGAALWRSLAKKYGYLNSEGYEALEEDLARIIGDVQRLVGAAKVHHADHP